MPVDSALAPPPGLPDGTPGHDLWQSTVAAFVLADDGLALLREACDCLNRLDDCRAAVTEHGTVRADGSINPAAKEARSQALVLGRLLAQLNLPPLDEADRAVSILSPTQHRARTAANARWRREKRS